MTDLIHPWTRWVLPLILVASVTVAHAKPTERSGWAAELRGKAERIEPTADERRWMEIPWVRTAAEAVEQARAEDRMIFVFSVASKDPLGRC